MVQYLKGVQLSELGDILPRVRPLIERALKRVSKRYTVKSIEAALTKGNKQLWVMWPDMSAILITQVDIYPGVKVLQLFLVSGKLPENWRDLLAYVQRWGISEGCNETEAGGDDRPGWKRKLGACGFRVACVMMRRELGNAG